jgi:hypothetical protein
MDQLQKIKLIKALSARTLPQFKKVSLNIPDRLNEGKLDESGFIIRYDKNFHPISDSENLTLGDVCVFDPLFFQRLRGSIHEPKFSENKYMILAFVELNSKKIRGIFCAIGQGDEVAKAVANLEYSLGPCLLLFWPEGFIKIQ